MKANFLQPTARRASLVLLAVFLLMTSSVRAEVKKGAADQRRIAKVSSTGARTPASARSNACAASCPADKSGSETIVLTTGTHLPITSKKRLMITDSAQNVQVLDRKQLERTGSSKVTDAIRRLVP